MMPDHRVDIMLDGGFYIPRKPSATAASLMFYDYNRMSSFIIVKIYEIRLTYE